MMQKLDFQQKPCCHSLIMRCLVSLMAVSLIQFSLFLLAFFLPTCSIFILFPISAIVMVIVVGLWRWCKKLAAVKASAPAFVFCSIFLIWALYLSVIRRVVSPLMGIVFNTQISMVVIGLCCMMSSDPGYVKQTSSCNEIVVESPHHEVNTVLMDLAPSAYAQQESSAEEDLNIQRRVRYCRQCQAYVKGFDHHCPAFGNCIGQKNHPLFVLLLVGFIISEASFVACASQFSAAAKSDLLHEVELKTSILGKLVVSTMIFSAIQALWQVAFLMWHLYCACLNIKTDEWINWNRYPEFQVKINPHAGQSRASSRFVNPYDKGILRNLREFLTAKG